MPLARLQITTLRMTHPAVIVALLLLMQVQVQNLMPMLEPLSEDRMQLGEGDEAPKEHPMATKAFRSKLVKSSHLLEIILFLQFVDHLVQLLALNKEAKL